jgi:hypothetical protein
MTPAVGILHELFGGYELNAAIYHVATRHLCRVGMFSKQFYLWGKRAKGSLHALAFTQPHGGDFLQEGKEALHLAFAGVAVFVTEIVDIVEIVFVFYDGLGIEQWLSVLTLGGARLKFKEYSVCLTWHSDLVFQSCD